MHTAALQSSIGIHASQIRGLHLTSQSEATFRESQMNLSYKIKGGFIYETQVFFFFSCKTYTVFYQNLLFASQSKRSLNP